MAKPPIHQLLIESALQPDLCLRLRESPDEVFAHYDLSDEEKEILRHPDHRLLPMLGKALAQQAQLSSTAEEAAAATPPAAINARAVPNTLMALTVVPCAVREEGQLKGFTYAVWVQPLPAGADPASLSAPAGATLPGEPLTPLHAVIQISAVQTQDAAGNPHLGLWGSFRQSTNVMAPPPPESSGDVQASPFQSPVGSAPVKAAVAAVRSAPREERYARLVGLLHALHQGDVR